MAAVVNVHTFKEHAMQDGTLVVSVPGQGMGNILVTDFLLEQNEMDHWAAFDSDAFPPVALLHGGKARFPVRVHANTAMKVAVLRSEFVPAPELARPFARAITEWAMENGIRRIVALDLVRAPDTAARTETPPVFFGAADEATRERALGSGLKQLEHGAVGGVAALLLLEGRLRKTDVVVLLAALAEPMDDARSVLSFARALPEFVPGLEVDPQALQARYEEIERMVKGLRDQARETLAQMQQAQKEEAHPAPSMYR